MNNGQDSQAYSSHKQTTKIIKEQLIFNGVML